MSTLTETLSRLGYGHLSGPEGRHVVYRRCDRSTVLVGDSAAVWSWLRERGLIGEAP